MMPDPVIPDPARWELDEDKGTLTLILSEDHKRTFRVEGNTVRIPVRSFVAIDSLVEALGGNTHDHWTAAASMGRHYWNIRVLRHRIVRIDTILVDLAGHRAGLRYKGIKISDLSGIPFLALMLGDFQKIVTDSVRSLLPYSDVRRGGKVMIDHTGPYCMVPVDNGYFLVTIGVV